MNNRTTSLIALAAVLQLIFAGCPCPKPPPPPVLMADVSFVPPSETQAVTLILEKYVLGRIEDAGSGKPCPGGYACGVMWANMSPGQFRVAAQYGSERYYYDASKEVVTMPWDTTHATIVCACLGDTVKVKIVIGQHS
jgi:hypothetical protein